MSAEDDVRPMSMRGPEEHVHHYTAIEDHEAYSTGGSPSLDIYRVCLQCGDTWVLHTRAVFPNWEHIGEQEESDGAPG
jgi:hypothetical protein